MKKKSFLSSFFFSIKCFTRRKKNSFPFFWWNSFCGLLLGSRFEWWWRVRIRCGRGRTRRVKGRCLACGWSTARLRWNAAPSRRRSTSGTTSCKWTRWGFFLRTGMKSVEKLDFSGLKKGEGLLVKATKYCVVPLCWVTLAPPPPRKSRSGGTNPVN